MNGGDACCSPRADDLSLWALLAALLQGEAVAKVELHRPFVRIESSPPPLPGWTACIVRRSRARPAHCVWAVSRSCVQWHPSLRAWSEHVPEHGQRRQAPRYFAENSRNSKLDRARADKMV